MSLSAMSSNAGNTERSVLNATIVEADPRAMPATSRKTDGAKHLTYNREVAADAVAKAKSLVDLGAKNWDAQTRLLEDIDKELAYIQRVLTTNAKWNGKTQDKEHASELLAMVADYVDEQWFQGNSNPPLISDAPRRTIDGRTTPTSDRPPLSQLSGENIGTIPSSSGCGLTESPNSGQPELVSLSSNTLREDTSESGKRVPADLLLNAPTASLRMSQVTDEELNLLGTTSTSSVLNNLDRELDPPLYKQEDTVEGSLFISSMFAGTSVFMLNTLRHAAMSYATQRGPPNWFQSGIIFVKKIASDVLAPFSTRSASCIATLTVSEQTAPIPQLSLVLGAMSRSSGEATSLFEILKHPVAAYRSYQLEKSMLEEAARQSRDLLSRAWFWVPATAAGLYLAWRLAPRVVRKPKCQDPALREQCLSHLRSSIAMMPRDKNTGGQLKMRLRDYLREQKRDLKPTDFLSLLEDIAPEAHRLSPVEKKTMEVVTKDRSNLLVLHEYYLGKVSGTFKLPWMMKA
jgi:hypothetical protein